MNDISAGVMARYINFILRFRIPALIVFLVITIFFCIQIQNLKMEADTLGAMYPEGHPFVPQLEAIAEMAPVPRMLVAILDVKDGDIYNTDSIHKIDRITKGLTGIDGILPGKITSLTRGMDHYNNTVEGLTIDPVLGRAWPKTKKEFEALKRRVAINPMGLGRYVAYDGSATMITATLVDLEQKAKASYEKFSPEEKAGLSLDEYKQQIKNTFQNSLLKGIKEIKAKEDDEKHTLYFMGPQLIEAQMAAMGTRQIPIAAILMFVFIIFLLALYFRSFYGVIVPLFSLGCSVLWAMGLFAVLGIDFNPMALTFPVVLGVLALGYGVLVVRQYYRWFELAGDKNEAVKAAYCRTPVMVSMITIGLTIAVFYYTGVPMIKDLGSFSMSWFLGMVVTMMAATPALLSLMPVPARLTAEAGGFPKVASSGSADIPAAGLGPLLLLIGLLMAVLAAGSFFGSKLAIGDNVPGSSYIRPNHPWNQAFNLMHKKFMGPYQLLVYAKAKEKGGLLDPEAMNTIGDFSRYLWSQPGVRDSIAFDMMVKLSKYMLSDGNPKWLVIPVSGEQVESLARLVMEQGGVEDFMDKSFTEATISPFFSDYKAASINAYAALMQAYINEHPSDKVDFRLGGGLLGMVKTINDGTRQAYDRILMTAFLLIFIWGLLMTRSLRLSIFLVLPLAAAQAEVWLFMAITGMEINLPVVIITAPAIGFGALFCFTLIAKFVPGLCKPVGGNRDRQEGPFGPTAGILFLGILIFVAMLPWSFIGMKFQADITMMLGIMVLLQAVSSLLFLPVMLDRFNPKVSAKSST